MSFSFRPAQWSSLERLSQRAVEWGQFVERVEEARDVESFAVLDSLPLRFPLQPWPVLIGPAFRERMAAPSRRLFDAVRKSARREVEAGRRASLASYYGPAVREEALFSFLESTDDAAHAAFRVDSLDTDDGIRCLELNAAGALGGWYAEMIGNVLRSIPVVERFMKEVDLDLVAADALGSLLRGCLKRYRRDHPTSEAHNLAIVAKNVDPTNTWAVTFGGYARGKYASVLEEVMPGATGELLLAELNDVVIDDEGHATAHGSAMHSVIEWYLFDRPERLDELAGAMAGKGLQVFDGPATTFLCDKRVLALVLEQCERGMLPEEDAGALQAALPWTRCVVPGPVHFGGVETTMTDLLSAERERLVLKKGLSFGGDDVLLGTSRSADDWDTACREALASGEWIVQELVAAPCSYPILTPEGVEDRVIVWGMYGVGDHDAEIFGRASSTSGPSVINSKRGAADAIVLTVDR